MKIWVVSTLESFSGSQARISLHWYPSPSASQLQSSPESPIFQVSSHISTSLWTRWRNSSRTISVESLFSPWTFFIQLHSIIYIFTSQCPSFTQEIWPWYLIYCTFTFPNPENFQSLFIECPPNSRTFATQCPRLWWTFTCSVMPCLFRSCLFHPNHLYYTKRRLTHLHKNLVSFPPSSFQSINQS